MNVDNKKKLYEQVRQAVYERWDPIGISAFSDEMTEYEGYIPSLCNMLEQQPNIEQIFEYLWVIETQSIGLSGDKNATKEFAIWLYQLAH
jgi:hypothetical protein